MSRSLKYLMPAANLRHPANNAVKPPHLRARTASGKIVWLVSLSLALIASTTRSASADDFLGGDGGGPFGNVNCPRGTVVVGLAGRTGSIVDTVQLICGKGRGDPDLDIVHPTRIGPSNGGGPVSVVCPLFDAATSIQVNVREHEGHVVVSQIVLHCQATLDGSGGLRRVFGGGGGGGDAGSSTCPANHYVAGFAGRSGSLVDRSESRCAVTAARSTEPRQPRAGVTRRSVRFAFACSPVSLALKKSQPKQQNQSNGASVLLIVAANHVTI